MNVEIFYVVSVRMPGEIILQDRKVGRYRPDRNQGNFFVCLFSRNTTIKEISVKEALIVTNSQFTDDVAYDTGIKRWLEA